MKKNLKYNIGIDIGTNSVGYAVSDENCNLLKFKGKNMWGVNLFEEGKSAKDTRLFRSTRRRLDRRRNRVLLLQNIMSRDVLAKDEVFYIRLKEAFLWSEDRTTDDVYTLFNDKTYNDVDYYNKFPTIYHLRKHLMTTNRQEDIRLIYLALHHIVKYRGNFLYEGQKGVSAENSQIKQTVTNFLEAFCQLEEIDEMEIKAQSIAGILEDTSLRKADKVSEILSTFNTSNSDEKKKYKGIASAMVGNKADFKAVFNIESEEKLNFSLASEDADIKLNELIDLQQVEAYEALRKVYSAFVLAEILKGDVNCISDAMINKYKKHKEDLKILKRLIKEHFNSNDYNYLFRVKEKEKGKPEKTYAAYVMGEKQCSKEDLYKTIKELLKQKEDELENDSDYHYCLTEIEDETFLPRLNSKENGAIPYQLHLEELVKIVELQGKYYPTLKENIEKLKSIVTFRIPYYVGPLNAAPNPSGSKQFAWMQRKMNSEKIYPWNFEDVVDVDSSAEKFIERMRNNCTYLPAEYVIPKMSLLYSEYEVLNEIKQIKIDEKFLPIDVKKALFDEVFKNKKKITSAALKQWLIKERKYSQTINNITGFQKENEFASSLTSYIDFIKIFGEINSSNIEIIEKIILWLTLFEDKKIVKRKIENEYPQISEKQIESICRLRYSGWSRLSKKLLEGIFVYDKNGRKLTIMDVLRNTNKNFMQIINDKELGFDQQIAKEAKPTNIDNVKEAIDLLAGSPAIKKGIKQSVDVVTEIVSIMKQEPEQIYIEFAREEGDKQRTSTRYAKIKKIFADIGKSEDFAKIKAELSKYENNKKALDDKMLYLYFTQNGKSMYSGKPLDISMLSQTCQIDHIIPQSYIKDDSFDNIVLVLNGENQQKSDRMLIDPQIISNRKALWTNLLRNKLITQKKFDNLCRDKFDKTELKGFINRQLVETRQIIKHVANLLGQLHPDSNIVEIKAELPSNLRMQYGLYKNRSINDYHHAHDAYLASIIGRYVRVCYPDLGAEFDYFKFDRFARNKENVMKTRYGFLVGDFKNIVYDKKTGEVIWDGKQELARLRACINYKDCYISKKTEEQTGQFYKQTILPKDIRPDSKLLPIKKDLSIHKYGGYIEPSEAYSAIVEYDKKKKREKQLVGIPLYVVKLQETKENAVIDYLINNGYNNPVILKDKIKKYQKFIYEGSEYYLSSSKEVHNAKQLVLSESSNDIVFRMNHPKMKSEVSDQELINLYDILCEKIENLYPHYKSVLAKLQTAREKLFTKPNLEKIGIINEILIMLHANPTNGNFAKYSFGSLKDRVGRMTGKTFYGDDIIFINTSITGLFENRTNGKDLS